MRTLLTEQSRYIPPPDMFVPHYFGPVQGHFCPGTGHNHGSRPAFSAELRLDPWNRSCSCVNPRTRNRNFMRKKRKKLRTRAKATDERAEEILWECLNEVPFLQANRVKIEQRLIAEAGKPDVEARVSLGDGEKIIFGQVKENGQPRLVREAIADLSKCCQAQVGAYGVVIAPEITPDAARICRQEGFGYVDYGGNCLLAFDHIFIHKIGRPKSDAKKQKMKSWYSPRVERVI